jgi:Na+-transporting NADH:ubiquinone oxidoreductase subunit A
MADITLKKGYDIRIEGAPSDECAGPVTPGRAALVPTDFAGIKPALLVREGDRVKAGTPLFTDKATETLCFVSPLSGRVERIARGDRRVITAIVIAGDGKNSSEKLPAKLRGASSKGREDIIPLLLETGLFPSFRQRPFAVQANPADVPRDIFISAFDTAPLAPRTSIILEGSLDLFAKGLSVLTRLTSGRVHLSARRDDAGTIRAASGIPGVEVHRVRGPHPAGCVGVQIHHIAPVRSARDIVWYCTLETVVRIGRLFAEGVLSFGTTVAVGGPAAPVRKHVRTIMGAGISSLTGRAADPGARYISGNVLTGRNAGHDGFLGFFDNQLSIVAEAASEELFGWLSPGLRKESASGTFLSRLFPGARFAPDTGRNGSVRPFVATGIYEDVLPMNIHPVHLIKSILAGDIGEMEGLGIYEITEDEIALCEYICPSKHAMQEIVRRGIDMIIQEG